MMRIVIRHTAQVNAMCDGILISVFFVSMETEVISVINRYGFTDGVYPQQDDPVPPARKHPLLP